MFHLLITIIVTLHQIFKIKFVKWIKQYKNKTVLIKIKIIINKKNYNNITKVHMLRKICKLTIIV